MQMRKSLLIGMVIASLWAATGLVQPVWGQDGGRAGRGGMLLRLMYKAGLTDDQKAQVKQILANHRANLQLLRGQLQTKREQIVDMLLGADTPTMDTLQPLVNDANGLQAQIGLEWHQVLLEMRTILTADQLTKVAGLKDQLRELHQGMRSLWRNQQ
jgi:hypothetical protein